MVYSNTRNDGDTDRQLKTAIQHNVMDYNILDCIYLPP